MSLIWADIISRYFSSFIVVSHLHQHLPKKSKKRDFVPFALDPYPPTIKRDILIMDIIDFIWIPTLLIKIGTFLRKKKKFVPSSFLMTILRFWPLHRSQQHKVCTFWCCLTVEFHKCNVCKGRFQKKIKSIMENSI